MPFDHPLYVLYSSGTTGLPKAIVHGHGGIVARAPQGAALHHDLGPGDRFFWFTTTGWMMWNYLVSGLLTGATIVLFDGDPDAPDRSARCGSWRPTIGVTVFGTSAPFLMACRKAGLSRPERGALRVGRLDRIAAAGRRVPLDHDDARRAGGPSICGGTDVCTAFVGAAPVLPVRAGEISRRLLGCAVEAFDPDGAACPPGVTGELVSPSRCRRCRSASGATPTAARYRAAYFEDFPGVWRHGDWVTFSADGSCVITGRSDATLNRGGVRLGTSDFYTVVEGFPEVADTPGGPRRGRPASAGERPAWASWCCSSPLRRRRRARRRAAPARIKRALALRAVAAPRARPIEVVPVIPRTLSGKKLEVPVKRILAGADADTVASRDSLADPTALDHFRPRSR